MKLLKLSAVLATAFAAQAASAGVVFVEIDSFNDMTLPVTSPGLTGVVPPSQQLGQGNLVLGGSWTVNAPTAQAYVADGLFNVAIGTSTGSGTLQYTAAASAVDFASVAGTSNGQIYYSLVYSDHAGNTIAGSAIPLYNYPSGSATQVLYSAYTNNAAVALSFNGTGTRSWDVAIDSIGVSFNCANLAADTTVSYSNLASFFSGRNNSCAAVPVPGSLALLGLGGIAAGLVSRRRAAK